MIRRALLVCFVALSLLAGGHLAAPLYAQPLSFIILQDAQTTGNGDTFTLRGVPSTVSVWVEWSSGTSAGVVTIEEATTSTYTGTWSPAATVTWAAADSTETVHFTTAAFAVMRARISTTVVGGTVTVRIRGQS